METSKLALSGDWPSYSFPELHFRVLKKFTLDYHQFAICAWDSTIVLPVAVGGNCIPGNAISINSATGNGYRWVPIFDANGNIIAELNGRGNNLGAITSSLFVNSSGTVRSAGGHFYLDRNLTITPQTNGGARVRLYFKDSEYQALAAAGGNIISLQNLKINRTHQACEAIFNGPAQPHLQDSSGHYGPDHFIEFTISGFSSFFIDGNVETLPLEFLSIDAQKNGTDIIIHWSVVQDPAIAQFTIQRSTDGNAFVDIREHDPKTFMAATNNSWQYNWRDPSPGTGIRYYRVKMKGENGRVVYSKVVAINAGTSYTGPLRVYPNPVSRWLVIEWPAAMPKTELTLFNSSGVPVRKVFPASNSNGVYTLDMQGQRAGIYFLKWNDGEKIHTLKVVRL